MSELELLAPQRRRCDCIYDMMDWLGGKITRVQELTRHLSYWQKGLLVTLICALIGGNVYNIVNNIRKYQYSQVHPIATAIWSDVQPGFELVMQVPINNSHAMNIEFKCAKFYCSDTDCSGFNTQVFTPCGTLRLTTQDILIMVPDLPPDWIFSIIATGPDTAEEFKLMGSPYFTASGRGKFQYIPMGYTSRTLQPDYGRIYYVDNYLDIDKSGGSIDVMSYKWLMDPSRELPCRCRFCICNYISPNDRYYQHVSYTYSFVTSDVLASIGSIFNFTLSILAFIFPYIYITHSAIVFRWSRHPTINSIGLDEIV